MLKIVNIPNPVLSQISKPVSRVNFEVRQLLEEMKISLLSAKDPVGVGLAAPQVGKSMRIFIVKQKEKSPIFVFINPVIEKFIEASTEKKQQVEQSEKTRIAKKKAGINKNVQLEGCLSLPNIWGEVKRTPSIKISYSNENGKEYCKEFNGFLSTIIQHEMDHLQGILFPERVLEQKGTLYKSHKNEKNEDVFEEIEI